MTATAELLTPRSAPAPQPATPAPGLLASARILVVDDVATNVDLLDRLLRKAGAETVVGFTDPVAALTDCVQTRPDLILLDLHMHSLDGLGFLARLDAILAEDEFVPVIVLTADITEDARRRVLAAGAKDFLTKPFNRVEVLLRVHNLLEIGSLYSRVQLHRSELQAQVDAQLDREREVMQRDRECLDRLEGALAPDGMSIVYQPFVDLAHGEIVGAEALARFAAEPIRPPNVWFAEAESIGELATLELSAIARAVSRLGELPDAVFLSVNVSPSTAVLPGLIDLLATLPAHRIVLEITEHSPVADYDGFARCLAPFIAAGGRIAVDDAGAGFAGLQHILRLRPQIIKLDIALTTGIDRDPARRALAASLVQFAREIGATLIAEGIETAAELGVLTELGVTWGQGYYLARPAPLPLHLLAHTQ